MDINEDFFLNRIWCRKGVYWKTFKVTSLTKNGKDWDATLECEQTFASQFESNEDKKQMIIQTLLMELDMDDKIELDAELYLNIVHEFPYNEPTKKRFLVNISPIPNDRIDVSEYINRVIMNGIDNY